MNGPRSGARRPDEGGEEAHQRAAQRQRSLGASAFADREKRFAPGGCEHERADGDAAPAGRHVRQQPNAQRAAR